MEKQTQRKKRAGKSDRLSSCPLLAFSLSNYLSAGVSAAERPIVTTEQPANLAGAGANLAGAGVTKQGALARPLAYPVVIGSL